MDIKALREEYSRIHAEADKVLSETSKTENGLTAEIKEAQDRRFARMDEIKALYQQSERLASAKFEMKEVELPNVGQGRNEFAAERSANGNVVASSPMIDRTPRQFSKDEQRMILNRAIQSGNVQNNRELAEMYRSTGCDNADKFSIISTTGSSVFLPTAVLPPIPVYTPVNAYRAAKAALGSAVISTTDTASINLPLFDDSANVGLSHSEGATSEQTADGSPSNIALLGNIVSESGTQWYSNTMLLANGFDVLGFTLPQLQQRLLRRQSSLWTTIVKNATVGKTSASRTALTYAELLAFEHSLPVAYRTPGKMAIICSDGFMQLVRGLVDDQHRPVMDQDPQNVFQSRIHGIPVFISEHLDAIGSTYVVSGKAAVICDVDKLFVRDVVPPRLETYRNYPLKGDQTGMNLFWNADFNYDSNGVRLFAVAA